MSRRLLRSQHLVFVMASGLLSGGFWAPHASAQNNDPVVKEGGSEAVKPAKRKTPERIQVTGSRLKRTQVEGVSTVIKVDAEAIEKSGVSSVGEVLQNMALSVDGSYSSGTVADERGNVTNVNLRGLGPENTLVLLDGRRLPDEGGQGVVDLSVIPIAAVERIEVLKDSASAIYGSDATGGVVNIITKKNFEGNAVYLRGAKPTGKGGNQSMYSYVNGVNGSNYRVLTALSYRKTDSVFNRNRDWTRNTLSRYSIPPNINLSFKKLNPATGLVETQNDDFASPNCPPESLVNGICRYDYSKTMALSPEKTELGILNNIDYQLNDRVSLFTTLRAQRNENKWNMAANAGSFTISPAALAANPALNLSKAELAEGTEGTITYRSLLWGNREWEETNNALGGTVGLKGDLGSGWELNVSASRSTSQKRSKNPSGFFLKSPVENAIANGTFNIFATDLASDPNAANFVNETHYEPFVNDDTTMTTYDASVSGDIFTLPGGTAALAVGVSRIDQYYKKKIDYYSTINDVYGVEEDQGGTGDRQINAVYAEMGLPVTSQLELQLAARHDQYNDFGSTTNPKLGVKYLPVQGLLVRGSVGTGFKAPTLNQIYNQGTIGLTNVYDRANAANIPERQDEVEIQTYGNPDLKQETSLSYNVGIVADPLDPITLSADYWYVKIKDVIRPVDAQKALDAAADGTPLPDIDIQHYNNDPTARLKRIRVPTANLGQSEDAGYDLGGEFRLRPASTQVKLTTDYSRKVFSKSVAFPGAPQKNIVDETGHPAWRIVSGVEWQVASSNFLLKQNVIAGQQKTPAPDSTGPAGRLGSFRTYDAQYSWNHPWNGNIAVGALNVTNAKFPRDDNERPGDDQRVKELYSADGRLVYVNVNQTF